MRELEFECDDCNNHSIIRGLYVVDDIHFCPVCGEDVDNVMENGDYEEDDDS